ncbi:MAG TPA: gamma-glutamyl-gamma-aminobutyrate hydrolase family protein [Gemmatimonadaceae bacterium]|nr:gamma-glutamyl-gamma-aminobutyrate hydrolase family protein [Gemmatimonadaceae bacterium]
MIEPAPRPLRIGIAACFMHADPARPIFKGKTLLYLEESLAHWLMEGGALPHLLPTPAGGVRAEDLIADVDALVLQGGTDVAPESYGESPIRPEWAGDRVRDRYETLLIEAAMALDRPVLGICRGIQMLNVALGGSLLQDIGTQCPGALVHREFHRYDQLQHDIAFEPGSSLARIHPGCTAGQVNTVHHQAIKVLAHGLRVEARSVPDGLIEAVRFEPAPGTDPTPWLYAVQWHPEFQDPADASLLSTAPLRDLFLEAVTERRRRRAAAGDQC